jgi:hypothetical protein
MAGSILRATERASLENVAGIKAEFEGLTRLLVNIIMPMFAGTSFARWSRLVA